VQWYIQSFAVFTKPETFIQIPESAECSTRKTSH
jgi:hypothetical protein